MMRATIVTSLITIFASTSQVALAQAPTAAPGAPTAAPAPLPTPAASDTAPEPQPAAPAPEPAVPPPYPPAPQELESPAPDSNSSQYPPVPPYPPAQPPAPPGQVYEPELAAPEATAGYPHEGRRARRQRRMRFRDGYDPRTLAPGERLPPRYRYIEGAPLPEGYHIEHRANRGLVGGGAALVAVPYLVGAFTALSLQGEGSSEWLALPLVGPWVALGARNSSCGEIGEPPPGGFDCFSDQASCSLLVTSGVMQALGVGLITLGLVNTREYAVADYAKVQLTPVATPTGGALLLTG